MSASSKRSISPAVIAVALAPLLLGALYFLTQSSGDDAPEQRGSSLTPDSVPVEPGYEEACPALRETIGGLAAAARVDGEADAHSVADAIEALDLSAVDGVEIPDAMAQPVAVLLEQREAAVLILRAQPAGSDPAAAPLPQEMFDAMGNLASVYQQNCTNA